MPTRESPPDRCAGVAAQRRRWTAALGSRPVELTETYRTVLPSELLERYDFAETRNAAAVLKASNPVQYDDVVAVLSEFELLPTDITEPGRNKSAVACWIWRFAAGAGARAPTRFM